MGSFLQASLLSFFPGPQMTATQMGLGQLEAQGLADDLLGKDVELGSVFTPHL